MKKTIITLAMCMVAVFGMAQETKSFEGEILFETFENYSDYILRMSNSIYFNGVHKMRLIVKGDKMHLIDETTKCHAIADNSVPSYVHFCELTKTGMDYGKNIDAMRVLTSDKEINCGGALAPLTNYTFAKTDTEKNILNKKCFLYAGNINREMGGIEQKYEVKSYVSDIPAPNGYKWNLYGLETPGIALKYSYKYDGGHVSVMNVGELSIYVEADVTEIIPREVNDNEFDIPADYKISKGAKNAFALMKYMSSVKKQLVKLGIKGEDNAQKTTGVHYKTNDEWDF